MRATMDTSLVNYIYILCRFSKFPETWKRVKASEKTGKFFGHSSATRLSKVSKLDRNGGRKSPSTSLVCCFVGERSGDVVRRQDTRIVMLHHGSRQQRIGNSEPMKKDE
jgi:hypothetical protein